MHKAILMLCGLAGILLGICFFVSRRRPDPAACRKASLFLRCILLTAVVVASLLSCGCATLRKALNLQPASAEQPATPEGLSEIERLQAWKELRVFWNLINGDPRILEDDRDGRHILFGYSRNRDLIDLVISHRIDELRPLVGQGKLSEAEIRALHSLFDTMIYHYRASSTSCYIGPGGRAAEIVNARSAVHKQAKLLRVQHRRGTLAPDVVAKTAETLETKLKILDVLDEAGARNVREDDIRSRLREWWNSGKADSLVLDEDTRDKIVKELLAEQDAAQPAGQKRAPRADWDRHRTAVAGLVVSLSRYDTDPALEKSLCGVLSGDTRDLGLVTEALQDLTFPDRAILVDTLARQGKKTAIPILEGLLGDPELHAESRGNDRALQLTRPVREAAREALKKLGVPAPPPVEAVMSNTPEGRAMIRAALRFPHDTIVYSAIWPAGCSEDPSLVPLLEEIAKKHPEWSDRILNAVAGLGGPEATAAMIRLAESGCVSGWRAVDRIAGAGGAEAEGFLERRVLSTGALRVRWDALEALVKLRQEKALPVLMEILNGGDSWLSLAAARHLFRLGDANQKAIAHDRLVGYLNHEKTRRGAAEALTEAGFEVPAEALVELLKTSDYLTLFCAYPLLNKTRSPGIVPLLEKLAEDSRYAPQAMAALAGRGGDEGKAAFRRALQSGSDDVKKAVLREARRREWTGAEEVILEAFDAASPDVRMMMAFALGGSGTGKSLEKLRGLLSDDAAWRSRRALTEAIQTIIERESEKRVKALRQRRADPGAKIDFSDDDLYAMAVLAAAKDSGDDRDFAKELLDEQAPRSTRAVLRCLAEYPFKEDSEYSHDPRDRLFARLERLADRGGPEIVKFLDGTDNRGKALAIAALAGDGYAAREPDPINAIQGLREALTRCAADREYRLRAEAKRLLAVLVAAPKDRPLAKALFDLGHPHHRRDALEWLARTEGVADLAGERRECLITGLVDALWGLGGEWRESCRLDQAVELVTKLDDARFVAPLKAFLEQYDPEAEESWGIGLIDLEPINKARDFLLKHGVEARRLNDGRFGFEE